jgi:hypothetical protein
MLGRDEKMRTKFWFLSLNGSYHFEGLGVSERIVLKLILKK